MKTYTPDLGETIDEAIKSALLLSQKTSDFVSITFNGIVMEVLYPCNKDHYQKVWKQLCKKRSEEYNNSPEGKTQAFHRATELTYHQEKLDELMLALNTHISNEDLLNWLIDFTTHADYIGTVWDKIEVKHKLMLLGFKANMWVGYKGKWTLAHKLECILLDKC